MEILSIYYDDNTNTFEDNEGCTENSIVGVLTSDEVIHYKRVGGTYYRDKHGVRYEIVFPIREDTRRLQYDSNTNIIYDEDGSIVFNIFSIIDPNTLYLFKKKKEIMVCDSVSGGIVELMWLN